MDLEAFRQSLRHDQPPVGIDPALAGLWWDAKGDWTKAHESAQRDKGPHAAWVHAYLHRKEGDTDNAAYWYGQAGRAATQGPLADEWLEIVKALLRP